MFTQSRLPHTQDTHTSYASMLFAPVFFCTMGYGLIYLVAGAVAAIAVTGDRYVTKASVVLGSMLWGMFCGFIAGMACFSIIAGIYYSFPLAMSSWEAVGACVLPLSRTLAIRSQIVSRSRAAWGLGLVVTMQVIAVVRRLYVYI